MGMSRKEIIAHLFPGRFPGLYSTLDNPIKVPVQEAAYRLAHDKYLKPGNSVLDVGCGLGYGLEILANRARRLAGIEIDQRAVRKGLGLIGHIHGLVEIRQYNGVQIPYNAGAFDLVTCVDVLEHVRDYMALIQEMVRTAASIVLISTPNRRPEFTRSNGKPKNPWHLREWTYHELDAILNQLSNVVVEWNFINGSWEGPFSISGNPEDDTLALSPVLVIKK